MINISYAAVCVGFVNDVLHAGSVKQTARPVWSKKKGVI